MDTFLAQLKEALDVEDLEADTILEEIPEWDSLAALSVLALLSDKYRINLPAGTLRGGATARTLFERIKSQGGC